MAYSRVVTEGDGTTTQFAVNFALDFLQEEDVTCRVGTEVDGLGDPVYRAITFLTTNLIQVGGAVPGDGVQIVFERTVDKEALRVDYNNGDQLDEDNLMTAQKQLMMAVHEVLDGRYTYDASAEAAAALATAQATIASDQRALSQADAAAADADRIAAAASAAAAVVSAASAASAAAGAVASKVTGPASATNNAAVIYDSTTGKLVKNSPLLIDPTTGALSRASGLGVLRQGMTTNATAVPAGYIGEFIRKTKTMANADPNFNWVPCLTGVDCLWNSIVLTPGCWEVSCQTEVFGNSGIVFSHMHASFGLGITNITTAPDDGRTVAFHITSNHPNGWGFASLAVPFYLPSGGTINAVAQVDFTGAPATAALFGCLQAKRFA